MSNGYGTELRERAMAYYESGKKQHEVCSAFKISPSTFSRWIRLKKETGDVSLRPRPTVRRSRKLTPELLTEYFTKHPDHFLREAQEHFKINASAIGRACRKFGITRKKNKSVQRKMSAKKTEVPGGTI